MLVKNKNVRQNGMQCLPGARPCFANKKMGAVFGSNDKICFRNSFVVFLKSSTKK